MLKTIGILVFTCTTPQIRRYLAKISGPLLDQIDIHIEVPRLSSEGLMSERTGESSATVRRRVIKAREKQVERVKCVGIRANAQMGSKAIQEFSEIDGETKKLLQAAIVQFNLSGRGYDRILKVSRTTADLECILEWEVQYSEVQKLSFLLSPASLKEVSAHLQWS